MPVSDHVIDRVSYESRSLGHPLSREVDESGPYPSLEFVAL